jgi:hypothetical protein
LNTTNLLFCERELLNYGKVLLLIKINDCSNKRRSEMMIILAIALFLLGLFVSYIVIETAVKNGINSSNLGQYIEQEIGSKEKKKSFLDDDLDNEN